MKIAFLHYHLKPGGVTTVLRHQVLALRHDARVLVISGQAPPAGFPCEVVQVPGVGYTRQSEDLQAHPARIAEEILDRIRGHFNGPCDLLHVHNPLLAKNHLFPDILAHLQQQGLNLFLQVHDFAEDGRPDAFYRDRPYPRDCHFGVLNRRDYRNLVAAGLNPEGLHFLPNCVTPLEVPPAAGTEPYILYPVRAIRRKNIGEALLLSHFLPDGQAVYISQPPNSPADFPSYAAWRAYAAARDLPIRFEMGNRRPFENLMAAACGVMTTSIAEGFGFAFLEPWTAAKFLMGRLLPAICRDFSEQGVCLDHLYRRIRIPREWLGRRRLGNRFAACLADNRRAYGGIWPADRAQTCLQTLLRRETIDFGLLDEGFQREVLDLIRRHPARRRELSRLNPFLETLPARAEDRALIRHNRDRVRSAYHPDRYRERLIAVYARILRRPVRHHIDRSALLAAFLNVSNLSLLKWSPYHG